MIDSVFDAVICVFSFVTLWPFALPFVPLAARSSQRRRPAGGKRTAISRRGTALRFAAAVAVAVAAAANVIGPYQNTIGLPPGKSPSHPHGKCPREYQYACAA